MKQKTKDAIIVGGIFLFGLLAMAFAMKLTGVEDGPAHSIWSLATPFDAFLVGCVVMIVVLLVVLMAISFNRPKRAT
jgi:hypothetical protein